ncbi:flagellar biosynthetic protein FliQ [Maritimibacter sp. HL-12]|nr:flagellar biosynthetic protein FliQ [Maritimibacter sp. HL-12]
MIMDEIVFYDTLRAGLWNAVLISLPVLTVALVAGLIVGLFQALTSIQEMTLTFVPKVAAMLVVFWLSMGFMTETLVSYFQGTIVPLIAGS